MSQTERRYRIPDWRLPPGVAPGTWEYTQREWIANEYSDFLQFTPLIGFDLALTLASLPPPAPNRQSRVLDLGCGDGRALRALRQAGYEVLGIDMSQAMLTRAVTDSPDDRLHNKLIRANLVQLDGVKDAIADHAICLFSTIGMIRGRTHRRTFLRHTSRLIKPHGTLVLHVHNRNDAWRDRPSSVAYLRSAWSALRSKECEVGDRTYAYRGLADMFLHTYSLRELKQDLRASGWQIKRIVSLSPKSDSELSHQRWLPSLRAGGFIAIAMKA
jgi:ubiquinone/menaquinone biosynthesis C-methylase UbiE